MQRLLESVRGLPLLCLGVWLSGCASWHQTEQDVYWRRSGETLHFWKSRAVAGEIQSTYAFAAAAAYQDPDDQLRKDVRLPEKCHGVWPAEMLKARGWKPWKTIPYLIQRDTEIGDYLNDGEAMRHVHLRAQVWANEARREVVVAFGGTVSKAGADWLANFRWALLPLNALGVDNDAYSTVTKHFLKVFRAEYNRRATHGESWLFESDTKVIAAGHSLGGGLAQRFAYETFFDPKPTTLVYAFDPSPVTGKRDSDAWISHQGEVQPYKGLNIYRIFNRGEILASVRSMLSWANMNPDSNEEGQSWTDFRYLDDWSLRVLIPSGSVHAHGIFDLACFMTEHPNPQAVSVSQ